VTKSALRAIPCLIFALCPGLAAADGVRVAVGPSGRKVILNEGSSDRTRRLSATLVAVPDVELEPMIARHSGAQNLDPKLVKALIQVESGYNLRALSNKGAIGLMQLMPATASLLDVRNPYDADDNLRGGTRYLRQMLDRFAGRVELALSAYNAGPGAVERHGGIPPYAETRAYVRRILTLYRGEEADVSAAASADAVGFRRKAHLVRGPNNRLLLTTSLGGSR
jgi:soluble lytic murein transglycosylase